VVDVVARHVAEGGIAVKGNHDEAIEGKGGYFNDAAQAAIDWARAMLTPEHRRFLAALPLEVREGGLFFAHASASNPGHWDYIDSRATAKTCIDAAGGAPYTFVGHLHDQMLYSESPLGKMGEFRPVPGTPIPVGGHRQWLAIVGSVGQPRDRNPAAAYTLFDTERAQVTFFRVAYDVRAAAAKIRRSGLPESLAFRVESGI
jgi:diadenosine tetraphosphatase ApaH/serine/threonine PP2A family protein phosphatase